MVDLDFKKPMKKVVIKKILSDGRIYSVYPKTLTDVVMYNDSENLTNIINDIYDKISGGKPDTQIKNAIKYIAVSEDSKVVKFYRTTEVDETTEPDFVYNIPESVVTKNSIYEFPVIGDSTVIYIDSSEKATYMWSDDDNKYYCIGRDYNAIDIIDSGDSIT